MDFFKRFRSKTCLPKLAISAAAVAVGAACPGFLGTAAAGVLGGLGQNLLSNVFDRWFPENSLPPSDHLNHDLELAVGKAIEGVVQELIDAGSPHQAAYQSLLRRDAAEVWRRMLIEEPCELDPLDPQELLIAAAKAQEDARAAAEALKPVEVIEIVRPFPPALDEATWRKWLVRLAARLEGARPIGDALDELAPALVDRFHWHLVQALKADFAKDGRAYAALQMATTHSILAIVRDQSARLAELGETVEGIVSKIELKLDAIRPRLHADDVRWFDQRFGVLETKLDDLHRDLRALAARIDAKLPADGSHQTHIVQLRGEIDRRDGDIRSRDARIARLEAQLRDASRLAQEGDAEAEAALAYARKHDDIGRVVELLDRITDQDSERLRAQMAVQGGRIVDRRLESADYHFRKGDVATGRARLLDAIDCAPRDAAVLARISRFAKAFVVLDIAADTCQMLLRFTCDEHWTAIAECDLGDVEFAQGDRSSALKRYHRSLDSDRRSLQRLGETPAVLRDVAVSLNKIGDVELAENGPGSALPLYRESLEMFRRIVERFGETSETMRDVSVAMNKVGDGELAENGPKSALPLYRESLEIRRRIVGRFGETPEALRDMAVSLNAVGDVELAENGPESALSLYRESLEICRRIMGQVGETPEALRDVAVSLERIGDVERAKYGPKSALPLYGESLEIRRRIVGRFGETPGALRDVSASLDRVGDVERNENRPGSALPLYRESLEICRRIVGRVGEKPEALRDVAVSLCRTGISQALDGAVDAGLADAREALRLIEDVGRRWGVNWQIQKDIEKTRALVTRIEGMERPATRDDGN